MSIYQFPVKKPGLKIRSAPSGGWRNEPATEAQKEFLDSLLEDRQANQRARDVKDILASIVVKKGQASDFISELKSIPKDPPPQLKEVVEKLDEYDQGEDVLEAMGGKRAAPKGKFAIGEEPHIKFYKVARPTHGKWSGYVFVTELKGAPGNWNHIRLPKEKQAVLLDEIMKDPCAAQAKFGFHFVTCGRCDSPLSKPNSRAAGYGETCANHMGWPYPNDREAYAILLARYGIEKTREIFQDAANAASKPEDFNRWTAYVTNPYRPKAEQ